MHKTVIILSHRVKNYCIDPDIEAPFQFVSVIFLLSNRVVGTMR